MQENFKINLLKVLVLAVFMSFPIFASATTDASVVVISPNGKESITANATTTIKYSYQVPVSLTGETYKVCVSFSNDINPTYQININCSSVFGAGTKEVFWKPLVSLVPGSYKIRAVLSDSLGKIIVDDYSNASFSLVNSAYNTNTGNINNNINNNAYNGGYYSPSGLIYIDERYQVGYKSTPTASSGSGVNLNGTTTINNNSNTNTSNTSNESSGSDIGNANFSINTSQNMAQGGLVTCTGVDCNFDSLVAMINRIIKWFLSIATAVAAITFTYAGVKVLMKPESSGEREKAKEMFNKTVLGLIIILAAWIIVYEIINWFGLGGNNSDNFLRFIK